MDAQVASPSHVFGKTSESSVLSVLQTVYFFAGRADLADANLSPEPFGYG